MEFAEEGRRMQILATPSRAASQPLLHILGLTSFHIWCLELCLKTKNSTSWREVQRSINLAAERSIVLTQTGPARPLYMALPGNLDISQHGFVK